MLVRLRESFDDPLFLRAQRGVVPTLRALELAGPVKQVLEEIEALFRPSVFDPATADFTLALAATDYALQAVVVPFLAVLRRRAPGIRVAIRPLDNDHAVSRFERGDIDFALMTPEEAPPDLHAHRLFDEQYLCALRVDHPDAQGNRLTLDCFCALDHALVSYTGECFRGVTDDALARVGRQRNVVLSVTSFLVLNEILRTTDLIAVAPARLVAGAEGLAILDPPVPIPGFTKVAVWHERTHHDPGRRWVRALLFETCDNPARGPSSD